VQRVVSPGGIEAWLVHEPSLPLVALNFAFVGGATQDPADKPGVGYMVSSLLDDGAGELDAKAFQRGSRNAVELRFSVTQDYFYGSIRLLKDRGSRVRLLRLALNQPRFVPTPSAGCASKSFPDCGAETTDPGSTPTGRGGPPPFRRHPYGRPTNGSLTSVRPSPLTTLRTFARQVLTRDTLKIAAVGDIDAATLGQTLDRV
jgi:zinc protease